MEKTHTREQLKEMWQRPPERQIAVAQAKILEAIVKSDGKIRISWSGGKDSTFLLYLYYSTIKDLPQYKNLPVKVTFADTTNESKQIYKFIQFYPSWLENKFGIKMELTTVKPEKSYIEGGRRKRRPTTMIEVVKEYGIPMLSKEIAEKIKRITKAMTQAGIKFVDIKDFLRPTFENRDYLLSLGLNKTAVRSLIGWSATAKEFKQREVLSKKYLPFLWEGAPRISDECCTYLKKRPMKKLKHNGVVMTGEMAEESTLRTLKYLNTGCNGAILANGTGVSKPLGAMTNQAMLYGIRMFGIPMSEDYGDVVEDAKGLRCSGEQRTGCALCGFGIMYDWDRFIRLIELEPAKVKYAFTPKELGGLGYLEVCEYVNKYCKGKIQIPTFLQ